MLAKKKILIVDDEKDMRDALAYRLKGSGYEVIMAENGAQGLELASKEHPDLIVLDMMMPVLNGFEAYKQIKLKTDGSEHIPIVMLTARGKMKDTFESMQVEAFLPKPYEPVEILAVINEAIHPKVLVLNIEGFIKEKFSKLIESLGFAAVFVDSENAFLAKISQKKFKTMIAHLALITSTPAAFAAKLAESKEPPSRVIIFSDATVKGLEGDASLAIDEARIAWKMAGFERFYDHRFTKGEFSELVKSTIR